MKCSCSLLSIQCEPTYQSLRFVILTGVRLSNRCEPKLTGGRRILCFVPFASSTETTRGFEGAVKETSPSRAGLSANDWARPALKSCEGGSIGDFGFRTSGLERFPVSGDLTVAT